ncbi:acetolactate synthase [Lactarius pseudohatsudake]|nr:acetolactate synthase [Lactarius pseudohatsudake]
MSSTVRILSDGTPPKPPPPIDDLTSALDYKTSHKVRPPPLPKMDLPRSRSAEETVTNSMPPPNLLLYKKTSPVCCRVHPGSLQAAGSTFNIDSLVLEDLVPVWAVLDYTETCTISRELLLVKYPSSGPSTSRTSSKAGRRTPRAAHRAHAEQTKLEREMAPARHFEESTRLQPPSHVGGIGGRGGREAACAERADVSVIVEMTEKTARVKASFYLVKPFRIIEST